MVKSFVPVAVAALALLAALLLPPTPSAIRRSGTAFRRQSAPVTISDCLQAVPCKGAVSATVAELVWQGNRYDRKPVRVSGRVVMLKLRKGDCGHYSYFVLRDREGYHVSVTDYTNNRQLVERKQVTLVGFYRAELHNIDVCHAVDTETASGGS